MQHEPGTVAGEWGKMTLRDAVYRDLKIWPGGASEWNWRDVHDTHHAPGVRVSLLKELVASGATTIVLGTGYEGVLQITPEARTYIAATKDVRFEIQNTAAAINAYNALITESPTMKIAALFHSTC